MDLIKIEQNKIGNELIDTANARHLWEFLDSKQHFSTWIKGRIKDFGFVQGTDFIVNKIMNQYNQIDRVDYFITIDMAKELAMVERNEKGREARKFFIERDKKLSEIESKRLPATYREALIALISEVEKKEELEIELKEAQPKIEFANHIEVSKDSISIADFAKLLHKKGVKLGQNRMFTYFYDQKYLMSSTSPYQKWVDQGLFEIKEFPYINGRKEEKVAQKVMVTGKGQTYLTKKICNSFQIKEPLNSQTEF